MRKINFLKTVLSVATAMLISSAAFGQVEGGVDYAPYPVPPAGAIDYVTVGSTMGYYALPDPVYHPNYNLGDGWALTASFQWNWTVDNGGVLTYPGVANYATIGFPNPGAYNVTVAEQASGAFGGCVDATPTLMTVTAIAVPTGTMSIAPVGGWQAIIANQSYQICAAQAAQTVTVSFVENIPNALASYSFEVTELIEQLDGLGTVVATPQAEAVIEDFNLVNKVKATELDGADATSLPSAAFNAATPNFSFTFLSDALAVTQNAGLDIRTRYTYKVRRTGDAVTGTDYDFLSAISHKSNYLLGAGNEVYYAFANNTVSFIVNPSPVTGPIYHIPNNFNY